MIKPQLPELMSALAATELVSREQDGEYLFRHALTQEAVYGTLLVRDRRAIHRAIAASLEALELRAGSDGSGSGVADLAYHYYEAADWDKALEYARAAGELAQKLYAPHEAILQYTRAVEAAGHLEQRLSSALYSARGKAFETVGDFERARRDYERAQETARANHDRVAEWRAEIDLGFLWASRDYLRTGVHFQCALDLARALGDPRLVAHSLNRVGNWLVNVENPSDAQSRHLESLEIFQREQDPVGAAETLDLLGMDYNIGGDLLQANVYMEQAIALFRRQNDRRGLASSLTTQSIESPSYQTNAQVSALTLAQGIAAAEEALQIARDIGQRSAEAYALWALSECVGASGDYGRALELAQTSLNVAQEIEHRQWKTAAHFALGAMYVELFAWDRAQQHLENSLAGAEQIGSHFWETNAAGYLALVYVQTRTAAEARSLLDRVLPPGTAAQSSSRRLAQAARIQVALAEGMAAEALRIADDMIESAANHARAGVIPRLEALRGAALLELNELAASDIALERARQRAAELGLRSWLWRIHATRARLRRAQGRNADAEDESAAARTLIRELGATLDAEDLGENFVKRAFEQVDRGMDPSPR